MIHYEHFQLANGLNIYLHQDKTTPMAAVNIVYNVGSRDEDENKTGFAHLFEHLMFGGSKNIQSFDAPLQKVGGENNAFTSPDVTNYYVTLPVENIETAFWLESDRMMSLSFDPKVLEVQRKVVIEEFKQRYLNQPYGDVWLKLRPLTYQKHPYRWATIGKEIKHIEDATLEDVKDFFFRFYRPNNATLVVAGNIELSQLKALAEKWFGDIPAGEPINRNLPKEPRQNEARYTTTEAAVPLNALFKAYHMPGRYDKDYFTADLISDVLGRGKSSRLYTSLVQDQKLFNSISAHVMGSLDPGMLVIQGHLNKGVSLEEGNAAVEKIVEEVKEMKLGEKELEKVKNQAESTLQFSEVELLNRAMSLAFTANYGDPELCNADAEKLRAVTQYDMKNMAAEVLRKENSSTLLYQSKN
ncbi:M16 family metallopeptidase [Jiulongibacter sediminis]|uniref:Peptidase M16 n=1 Tax=Jiulongibacter sediminis TaxID=1605367 RepID=A0A0P7BSR4_9BACT|nr:pitrilysin family protein [Jiulongibacter sediminis]KPM47505.1 peptidase M16 [Jiulongibacter sediminis]TBX23299.1 peptidase M16 [Jiulongibacter sediminis]